MKLEPADGEALVGSPFGQCDDMPTVESRRTEPKGGTEGKCGPRSAGADPTLRVCVALYSGELCAGLRGACAGASSSAAVESVCTHVTIVIRSTGPFFEK